MLENINQFFQSLNTDHYLFAIGGFIVGLVLAV